MKFFLVTICFLMFTCGNLLGQNQSDSGFTDMSEAKNLIVNGLKEGKWIVYPHVDTIPPKYTYSEVKRKPWHRFIEDYYILTVYHLGIPIGMERAYSQGSLVRERTYINGKLNGIFRGYDLLGVITQEGYYKDGELNGKFRLYATGNGERNKVYVKYHTYGTLATEYNYVDGKLEGAYKSYNTDGTIRQTGIIR